MKGKKTDLQTRDCGISRTLAVIGDWWSLLIVRDAFAGPQRFGELQKSLGLAKNILSARLKKLTERGILQTVPGDEESAHHAYALTRKGEKLGTILVALWQWGEEYCFVDDELNWMLASKQDGEPLAKIKLQTRKGRPVGPRGFALAAKRKAR